MPLGPRIVIDFPTIDVSVVEAVLTVLATCLIAWAGGYSLLKVGIFLLSLANVVHTLLGTRSLKP